MNFWTLLGSSLSIPPFPTENLFAHYRAHSLNLNDGDPVTVWLDESGGGHHLVPGTSPTYKANQVNAFPAVRFVGASSQFLTVALGTFVASTVFMVRNTSAASAVLSIAQGASVNEEMLVYTTTIFHHSSNGNNKSRAHQSPSPSGYFLQTGRFGQAETSLDLWLNDVLSNQALGSTGAAGPYISTARTLFVAKRNETVPVFSTYDVAEILIYDVALSDEKIAAIDDYLMTKYAL